MASLVESSGCIASIYNKENVIFRPVGRQGAARLWMGSERPVFMLCMARRL
jgi:hypothetical protein